jgi:hypothetical protein
MSERAHLLHVAGSMRTKTRLDCTAKTKKEANAYPEVYHLLCGAQLHIAGPLRKLRKQK